MILLNRTQCSALRGIAIIGIFLHNFLHWLGPMLKENEYQFNQKYVDKFVDQLMNIDDDFILQLFSFFGHYGVPVFLFLSGYGLVLKYESGSVESSKDSYIMQVWSFIKKHYMKLFPMMMLGFMVFAMVDWITPGRHHWTWDDIIGTLTMTINFFPEPDKAIWPGPYWFFGLMMQLYLVYRIILYRRSNKVTIAVILLCWAVQMMCFDDPNGDALNIIRYNAIGGVLPFGMGILLARSEKALPFDDNNKVCWAAIMIVGVVLVVLGSLNFYAWLWVPALIVVVNVAFVKILPMGIFKIFDWVGALSSAIFVCHPITRKIFIPISRHGDVMDGLVLYVVTTLMLAVLFRMVINQLKKERI